MIYLIAVILSYIAFQLFQRSVKQVTQSLDRSSQIVVHRCIGLISVAANIRLVYCHRLIGNKLSPITLADVHWYVYSVPRLHAVTFACGVSCVSGMCSNASGGM